LEFFDIGILTFDVFFTYTLWSQSYWSRKREDC